ncbi:MAG: glycosyltransferase [bacterium]
MKILFTSPVLEHPAIGGPALRIENSIKVLSNISELHIISGVAECNLGGKDAKDFYKSLSKNFLYLPSTYYFFSTDWFYKVKRKTYKLLNLFGLKPDLLKQDAKFLLKYARKNSINVIWFGYGNISYDLINAVKKLDHKIKTVCDTDSVWSRFILRELPYVQSEQRRKKIELEGARKRFEEEQFTNICEITTAVSTVDSEYYKKLTTQKNKVQIFSNVIDLDNYKKEIKPPEGFKKPCIYLAGSFGKNSPMEQAARWVIDEIFPIVKKYKPDIHFYIVGRGSKETLSDVKDESITITGMVNSVLPYLKNSDVVLVPLWFESGTRFKILEAAACVVPIVSTALGAEGLNVEAGVDILIADKPADFARSILRLLNDKNYSNWIAKNAYRLVEKNYDLKNLQTEGLKILQSLQG